MNRRDILIAKLRAKQKIRQVMETHIRDFSPPQQQQAQPQQEMQNANPGIQPLEQPTTPPDQPV